MLPKNQEKKTMQKGFTLIELMVVIVIIGILSALAIPKMFGVSAKAKMAEAPGVITNWETLQSAYSQETGTAGDLTAIGFQNPTSKWITYAIVGGANNVFGGVIKGSGFGACGGGLTINSTYTVGTDAFVHDGTVGTTPACKAYVPNYFP
jgi:prepilin-type N-terminal cleavage/methylation domain-containing protein